MKASEAFETKFGIKAPRIPIPQSAWNNPDNEYRTKYNMDYAQYRNFINDYISFKRDYKAGIESSIDFTKYTSGANNAGNNPNTTNNTITTTNNANNVTTNNPTYGDRVAEQDEFEENLFNSYVSEKNNKPISTISDKDELPKPPDVELPNTNETSQKEQVAKPTPDLSEKMAKTNQNNVQMPIINSKSISNPASADVLGIPAQTINSYAPFQSPQQQMGWAYDPNSNYTKQFNQNVSEVKNQPIPTPSQTQQNQNQLSQPNQNPFTGNFDLTNPQNYINSVIQPMVEQKQQQSGQYEQWAKNQVNSLQNFQPSNEYGSNQHQRIMNGTTLPFDKPNMAPNDPSQMKLSVNMPTKEDMQAEMQKKISSSNIDSKISFGDKFKYMVNNGMMDGKLNTGLAIAQGVGSIVNQFTGPRDEFSGKEGNLAKTMDSTYDKATELAGKFGPWGKVVQVGMIANKAVGNIVGKLGGSTDGMTKADSILGSPFFQMTPLGIINGFGGKKADSFTKDTELFSQIGGSYGGSSELADAAGTVQGKKYGLFSSGARGEANRAIAEAKRQQSEISKINTEAQNRKALQGSMASMNSTAYDMQLQGGYDQSSVRVGRYGMVLRAKQIHQFVDDRL